MFNKQISKKIKIIITLLIISTELVFFNGLPLAQATDMNISELVIFQKINKERIKNNINPLKLNNKLNKASLEKAKYLVKNNYFAHNSQDGQSFSSWIKKTNYQYSFVGENLAKNFSDSDTLLKAWMESPAHRENILNQNFTETGIAVYDNIVVQIFGRPQKTPLKLKETIANHLSENLILYNRQNNNKIIQLGLNNLT